VIVAGPKVPFLKEELQIIQNYIDPHGKLLLGCNSSGVLPFQPLVVPGEAKAPYVVYPPRPPG